MEFPPAPVLDPATRRALATERMAALQALLARHEARGLLLDARADFAWLTVGGMNHVDAGSKAGAAPVLVTPERGIVLAPVNESARMADEEVHGLDLDVRSVPWWVGAAEEAASELAGGRFLGAGDVAMELESMRTVLASPEHARMEWLAKVTTRSVAATLESIRGGEVEHEVAAELVGTLLGLGVRAPVVLVAADDRIVRYRHPLPTAKPVRGRLMVVVVAECWGLHVAHTQFRELDPGQPELERAARALRGVLEEMRDATVVGRTLGDVLEAARVGYAERGFEVEWTLHHQGGTIGYGPRERIAVPGDETAIRPGMAFAWNPSVTGLKVEETLYLDGDGRQHVVATTPG